MGLPGNERADYWARRALVYNMTTTVPISPRTLKSITELNIRNFWQAQWTDLPGFKFQPEIGCRSSSFRKIRREEIAVCRLRTGITRLTYTDPLMMLGHHRAICEHCNEVLSVEQDL